VKFDVDNAGILDEELVVEMLECRGCEARYSIILGEDYLHEEARYCPFCGEYIIVKGDDY
jgi:predicted methyltransferase MtxX (methanogen marker protein 4)